MDFKEILGDLYTEDIGTKINESGIKFADLNTGDYISKKKYDDAVNTSNNYKTKYEGLLNSGNSNDSLQKDYDDLLKKNQELTDNNNKLVEENNNYKYDGIITKLKVDEQFSGYVKSEAIKGITDEIDFEKSASNFIEKNPQFKKSENVRKVNSSFSVGGGSNAKATTSSAFNNAILSATGRQK